MFVFCKHKIQHIFCFNVQLVAGVAEDAATTRRRRVLVRQAELGVVQRVLHPVSVVHVVLEAAEILRPTGDALRRRRLWRGREWQRE